MADDIFLTPEEQDERAKKWLKDNGLSIVVGVGLGLAGVIGYNQYQDNVQLKAEQASGLYNSVITTHEASQISDIDAQVSELKQEYPSSSYAAKAVLVKAKQLALSDQQGAMDELQWVIDNAEEVGLQHTARVRLAKLLFVSGETDAARDLASVQPSNGFDSHYQEILGDIERKQGNIEAARSHYEKASESLGSSSAGYAQVLGMKLSRLPKDEIVTETTSGSGVDIENLDTIENNGSEAINKQGAEAVEGGVLEVLENETSEAIENDILEALEKSSTETVTE